MMEPHSLRKLLSLPLGFALFLFFFYPLQAKETYPEYDEQAVIERLKAIDNPLVDLQYNSVVKGYIKGYVVWNRDKAARILGRTVLYFPLFDEYLQENGLPENLKYLSVVESALDPHATSPVGAVGLWQFMPGTGKEYGLEIDDMVDERRDPHQATQAAMQHLSHLYNKYDDWALALAAYNGGSGRVSRAIKRSRSKNFWRLRRYLPRETRNYVPAFIAATYLMEYYQEHEIVPEYPPLDLQITETIQVYDYISFYRIAQVTGLNLETIETLNPAYKRGIIPESPEGHYLMLPRRVMQAFRDYLETHRPDEQDDDFFNDSPVVIDQQKASHKDQYIRTTYTVKKGENLQQIATALNCSAHQIIAWNHLPSEEVKEGQKLLIFRPREIARFKPLEKMAELPTLQAAAALGQARLSPQSEQGHHFSHLLYIVDRKETLEDISRNVPGLNLPVLIDLNRIPPNQKLRPGDCLKVPKNN